jgi:hypothetical protein
MFRIHAPLSKFACLSTCDLFLREPCSGDSVIEMLCCNSCTPDSDFCSLILLSAQPSLRPRTRHLPSAARHVSRFVNQGMQSLCVAAFCLQIALLSARFKPVLICVGGCRSKRFLLLAGAIRQRRVHVPPAGACFHVLAFGARRNLTPRVPYISDLLALGDPCLRRRPPTPSPPSLPVRARACRLLPCCLHSNLTRLLLCVCSLDRALGLRCLHRWYGWCYASCRC